MKSLWRPQTAQQQSASTRLSFGMSRRGSCTARCALKHQMAHPSKTACDVARPSVILWADTHIFRQLPTQGCNANLATGDYYLRPRRSRKVGGPFQALAWLARLAAVLHDIPTPSSRSIDA